MLLAGVACSCYECDTAFLRNEDDDDDKFRVSCSIIFSYLIFYFLRCKIALKSFVNKLRPSPPSFSTIRKEQDVLVAVLNTL